MVTVKKGGGRLLLDWLLVGLLSAGCSSKASEPEKSDGPSPSGPGPEAKPNVLGPSSVVTLQAPAAQVGEETRLAAKLASYDGLTRAADVAQSFPVTFAAPPKYARTRVTGLDLIQASGLALDEAELGLLDERGFVISKKTFPTFGYGYATIYLADLPVYISADSILGAVHTSYDDILQSFEEGILSRELGALLTGMRARLAAGQGAELGSTAVQDADLYLAVAFGLLQGQEANAVAGASAARIHDLYSRAVAAAGVADVELFGVTRRHEDFSQFKPRGHYANSDELKHYFQAMIWLGRVDFRLIETQEDGSQLFRRPQFDGMVLLDTLIDAELRTHFDRIDKIIAAFVGEPDYMVLSEVAGLLRDLHAETLTGLHAISDQVIAQAIVAGNYGAQRISSHYLVNEMPVVATLPLSRSFALLGQRFIIDSEILSNVVYDRVAHGSVNRMMPSPLDVAFAALGNDQAVTLLSPELDRYAYAPDLARQRALVDDHDPAFWEQNFYNLWLGSVRELSPRSTSNAQDSATLFPVARTEAWGRRLLGAQLASWAELRHDTLLYAKQSYTAGATCEFPSAYVDPYPAFFDKLTRYAELGKELVSRLDLQSSYYGEQLEGYFTDLGAATTELGRIAKYERSGAELTPPMLAFVNQAVVTRNVGCGLQPELELDGWYKKLFFNRSKALEFAPRIADVHTQPTDEYGNEVGRVLHVGTGSPQLMVVVAESCQGPRAYAGLASSYFEKVTERFERLNDAEWQPLLPSQSTVPWLADLATK